MDYMDFRWSLLGVYKESTRSTWSLHGVHKDLWGSVKYSIIPHWFGILARDTSSNGLTGYSGSGN
jgi:hypothetical protein